MTSPRLVLLAVPGDKRTRALLSAAARQGVEVQCVPWADALATPALVGRAGHEGDFLRVESPGSDARVWHALSRLGGDARVVTDGEWRPGSAWFRGLARFFGMLEPEVAHLTCTHPTRHILSMTDKVTCQEQLERAGVPVPEALPQVRAAEALREAMRAVRRAAVFVKPRFGSSGAGVLAFRSHAGRETLTSTAHLRGEQVLNRKVLARYTRRAEVDALLERVLADGALVQRWIPKAGHGGAPFDLRVLVIHGRVAQCIARVGRGPITNLHLDATRADPALALARHGAGALRRVHEVSERAAACFPGHAAVGVDVMVDPQGRPYVLECNAWGDYLPGLLWEGCDSYELYLRGLFAPHVQTRGLS